MILQLSYPEADSDNNQKFCIKQLQFYTKKCYTDTVFGSLQKTKTFCKCDFVDKSSKKQEKKP